MEMKFECKFVEILKIFFFKIWKSCDEFEASLKRGIFENLNVRKIGLSTEIEKFEYKLYSLTD